MNIFSTPALYMISVIVLIGIIGISVLFVIRQIRRKHLDDLVVLGVLVPKEGMTTFANAISMFDELIVLRQNFLQNFISGKPTVSFEIELTSNAIRLYIVAPLIIREVIEKKIKNAYPQVSFEEVVDFVDFFAVDAIETKQSPFVVRKRGPSFLPISKGDLKENIFSGILDTQHELEKNEKVWVQIVLGGQSTVWRKNLSYALEKYKNSRTKSSGNIFVHTMGRVLYFLTVSIISGFLYNNAGKSSKFRSKKIEIPEKEQLLLDEAQKRIEDEPHQVFIRGISFSDTQKRARHLSEIVTSNYSRAECCGQNPLITSFRVLSKGHFKQAMKKRKLLHSCFVLTSPELINLFHFPSYEYASKPIVWGRSTEGLPPLDLPIVGQKDSPVGITTIGMTQVLGVEKKFGIMKDDRKSGIIIASSDRERHISGVLDLLSQDMKAGKGGIVIDTTGDLVDRVLDIVPARRVDDVFYIDPNLDDFQYSLNPFISGKESFSTMVEIMMTVFRQRSPENFGPKVEHIFRNTAQSLHYLPEPTLLDLIRIYSQKDRRSSLDFGQVPQDIAKYWREELPFILSDQLFKQALQSYAEIVGKIITAPFYKSIFDSPRNSLDFDSIIRRKEIVLVSLVNHNEDHNPRALFGSLLFHQYLSSWKESVMKLDPLPSFVCIDDFLQFPYPSYLELLSKSKKMNTELLLVTSSDTDFHQNRFDTLLKTYGTIMTFGVEGDRASFLRPLLSDSFSPQILNNLEMGEFIIRTKIFEKLSDPFKAHLKEKLLLQKKSRDRIMKKTHNLMKMW